MVYYAKHFYFWIYSAHPNGAKYLNRLLTCLRNLIKTILWLSLVIYNQLFTNLQKNNKTLFIYARCYDLCLKRGTKVWICCLLNLFFFVFFNKSERDTSCRPNYENNNDDSHKSSTWKPSQTQLFSECCAAQHKRVYR